MQDLQGRVLGNYQIIEELGRGGMGVVYRAYQPSLNRHVAVCTIYDQIPMSDPELRRRIVAALTLFNDCILRVAFSFGLPVLDLRAICVDPQDFSEISPIEPSAVGGDKIARAISSLVQHHDFSRRVTAVYT